MQVWETAEELDGWNRVKDGLPPIGEKLQILHFGGQKGLEIRDTGLCDEWGIKPDAKDGGHGKSSTVTHWRYIEEGE